MNVTKHNGTLEPLDYQKFRNSLTWAKGDLKNASVSDVEMQCKLHMYDGIPTSYILDVSIKATYDMSSLRHFEYDEMSRNLKLQKLYKQVFKSTEPHSLSYHISLNPTVYNLHILSYTKDELDQLNAAIDHSRDFTFSASGLDKTIADCQKKNGVPIETPQLMYMLIAMDTFHHNIPKIIEVYDALSTFQITLPTPETNALRTTSSDYASCCTIRYGDNVDSWCEADRAVTKHTVASAGVGVDIADISSLGDKVKNGTITHSGKIPVLKTIDALIGRASQNGRRGSATGFLNFFDPEIEEIFALKSPRTAIEKRINDLSYGIKLNQLIYDRAKAGQDITLFSVRQTPQLNSAFYEKDIANFIEMYEAAEAQFPNAPKISAQDLFRTLGTERFETSAYYVVNIDEVNQKSPYLDEISQSNICVEFTTPTLALNPLEPDAPAIGICVLGNINQAKVGLEDLPRITHLMVELQTMLALRQNHPTSQANSFVSFYRDIGIGLSNHAYWLAKNGWRYGQQEAMDATDEWMEHFAYGLISASCSLVDTFGVAPGFSRTSWAYGLMPIDRYKKTVDELTQRPYSLDWDALKTRVSKNGMANCGLSMVPPSESSSIGSTQTSSIEPIKEPLTIKDRQGYNLKQYAPEPIHLADKYDYAYDRPITRDFLKHTAIVNKWIDKQISNNAFYNPEHYEDEKVDLKDIISDMFYAKHLGIGTQYYQNTKIKDPDAQQDEAGCQSGGCSV
jgi:ribonucleoside-diphosphate reductase alpha chain